MDAPQSQEGERNRYGKGDVEVAPIMDKALRNDFRQQGHVQQRSKKAPIRHIANFIQGYGEGRQRPKLTLVKPTKF